MVKKIMIILILTALLIVSTSPAIAEKPTEPNGKGYTNREDRQTTNNPSSNSIDPKPDNPATKKSTQTVSGTQKLNAATHKDGHGFDDAGYNRTARIFNGTVWAWCMDKVDDAAWCEK